MITPEQFDIIGFVAFLVLFFIGLSLRKLVKKRAWVIIIIGAIGMVVDGYVVLTNFILK